MNALDCSDGLARCETAVVSVSRLATLPLPCTGPLARCVCPWDRVADCDQGCAVDGLEMVMDRKQAGTQLCAVLPDAGALALPTLPVPVAAPCEEGQRYVCRGARTIVECVSNAAVGVCVRGCYAEDASIDDDGVSREAAFAILCSR
ncbi:MAG: hypothetical protein ACLP1X_18500 [Polyangiaceae bacterium]|jgi:hypothetical protein